MSFWIGVSKRVGYAIGAAIFGPAAMIERRTRKTRRRALAVWISDQRYTRLVAPPRSVRWLVERQEDELTFALEVSLAADDNVARVVVPYEKLPDRLVAEERATTSGQSVLVKAEQLEVGAAAPESTDEWEALVRGALETAASLVRRSRAGYR